MNVCLSTACAMASPKDVCIRLHNTTVECIGHGTLERHEANGQKCALKQKPRRLKSNGSTTENSEENGGEELQKLSGRMQNFNTNVSGSNACFVKRRKESEALMEQEGMCASWFIFLWKTAIG